MLLILLGLFMWTTRLALRERSAGGVWAAITLWVVMGVPAALDRYDRAEAAGAYVFSGQRPGRRLGTGGRSASTPPSTPATGNTAGRPA